MADPEVRPEGREHAAYLQRTRMPPTLRGET